MSFYEVVAIKPEGKADYIACECLADAKLAVEKSDKYKLVFVRQYYKNRYTGTDTYRVLHRLTRRQK